MPRPIRRLHSQAPVRPAMVVADVAMEHPLGVALIADDDVIEAVAAERPDHAFREGVRLRCPRRSGEQAGAKPPNSCAERRVVDGVAVVDEEARDMIGVGGSLDHPLRSPGSVRVLGHGDVNQAATAQGEHDEHVQQRGTWP